MNTTYCETPPVNSRDIEGMSHLDLCRLEVFWLPYRMFSLLSSQAHVTFHKRVAEFGRMTPEMETAAKLLGPLIF